MEGEAGEFHDWELLHNSSESNSLKSSESVPNLMDLDTFNHETHSMIQTDYFSLDNYLKSDQSSVESDNPSWVDPESESRFDGKEKRQMWPDSGSDRDGDCKLDEIEAKSDVGFVGNGSSSVGFEGIGRDNCNFEEIEAKSEVGFVGNGNYLAGFEGIGHGDCKFDKIETKSEVGFIGIENSFERIGQLDDSLVAKNEKGFVGNGNSLVDIEEIGRGDEFLVAKNGTGFGEYSENEHNNKVDNGIEVSSDGEKIENDASMEVVKAESERENKKSVVWWKGPMEILKFCAFRVSPVWTFSMAAAVMGVVILTRRLYKMKKRSQAFQLKVTMDDKKVSQFMSRAARLNEAFSVVKRVPVIRSALPATGGLTQWPVMSLR